MKSVLAFALASFCSCSSPSALGSLGTLDPRLPLICSVESLSGPINPGFEWGNLGGWQIVSGDAFGNSSVSANLTHSSGPFHQDGQYFISSLSANGPGNQAVGRLESSPFIASYDMSFLISGGYDPAYLFVALVRHDDGRVLLAQTGIDDDAFVRIVWDTSEWSGETVHVLVHDDSKQNPWGHINFDDLRVGRRALRDNSGLTFKRIGQQHTMSFDVTGSEQDDCVRFSADALRPQYHYTPYQGWINDPAGLIYWNGKHHLFSQFHPDAPLWGPMHWAHAESTDAVHWRQLPVALFPKKTNDSWDLSGRFTGSAIAENATNHSFKLFFTDYTDLTVHQDAVQEVVSLASTTDGISFIFDPSNPIVTGPPPDSPKMFRDPKIFRDFSDDSWKMVLGSSGTNGGKVYLYRSNNLVSWSHLGTLHEGDGTTGSLWECPNFFPLQDKWVLIYGGANSKGHWVTGTFNGSIFVGEKRGQVDYGAASYAAQWYKDARGRDLAIVWMGNWETTQWASRANGWAGQQSLTREMFLLTDGSLGFRPIAELDTLAQGSIKEFGPRMLVSGGRALHLGNGDTVRVKLSLDLGKTTASSIAVSFAQSHAEAAFITYDVADRILSVDTRQAGYAQTGVWSAVLADPKDKKICLDIFIDRSSVEVFTGQGVVISSTVWARYEESTNIQLVAQGGTAALEQISFSQLGSSWC